MIKINKEKAIEITKEKVREYRKEKFAENDLNIQNTLVDGKSPKEFVEIRNELRDLPQQCDGKNVEELKEILKEIEKN